MFCRNAFLADLVLGMIYIQAYKERQVKYNKLNDVLYTLTGKLAKMAENFVVLENGGFGFKVLVSREIFGRLPKLGEEVKFFCFLHNREDSFELYGFLEEEGMKLFDMLQTVSGVGPKTALGILGIDRAENIMAAILEKRTELLTRTSGIGKKTAERIILELQGKINLPKTKGSTSAMDLNFEVEEALAGLGYSRHQVRKALNELSAETKTLEERLKATLKILGKQNK